MSELMDRLAQVVGEHYAIERQVGQGGMATVFLASDLRHGRQVAIKLFRPELAAMLGHERFLREIRISANLQHPNILPLFDSGQGDGLLYYVMPFVEGESLAERIRREGQLPLEDAVAIARQVALALEYAHGRGIVHRDIKPDNIMLTGGTALVADFGIAHAMEQTGEKRLTSTGFAVGTPSYMSPEQSMGTGRIDGRSDIYSLGCVLYEMLVGEPPFSGISAMAIMARHSVEHVPSVRAVRNTVPPALELVVHKSLAKSPADRFATAGAFATALDLEKLATAKVPAFRPGAKFRPAWLAGAAAVLAVVVLLMARPWSALSGNPPPAGNADVVAVLPFAARGEVDTAAARILGSVAEQIARRLPGDGGPRAVPHATLLAALPPRQRDTPLDTEAIAEVARRVGAGRVIRGLLWNTGNLVTIGASLEDPTGRVISRVDAMAAPRDSLMPLLDRVVVELLARSVALPRDHQDRIAALPLPAARAFLGGRRAFFLGRFTDAARAYDQVLDADSTCYPAALGLAAAGEADPSISQGRALRLAAAEAGRMRESDSLLLYALSWSVRSTGTSMAERIEALDEAAANGMDDPVRWYLLGERLTHQGPWLGIPEILERAATSFRRALEIEPDFVPALGHLLDLAASGGDTATVRVLGDRYLRLDSVGGLADYYRWRVAVALDDQAALQEIRARMDSMAAPALDRIVNVAQLDGVALEDAERAAKALWAGSSLELESRWGMIKLRELALNRGRTAEAATLFRRQVEQHGRPREALVAVVEAVSWGADTALARSVLERYARHAADVGRNDDGNYVACAMAHWRLAQGTTSGVAEIVTKLRGSGGAGIVRSEYADLCAAMLDAQLARANQAADAATRLRMLDSIAGQAPATITWLLVEANLTAARLWERAGNRERALSALRRRQYITDFGEPRVLVALSTMLREEARLAAAVGDEEGAREAERKVVILRERTE